MTRDASHLHRPPCIEREAVPHVAALTMEQVEQYGPPPNPAKEADTRFESYVKTFGTTECWELDSLSPAVIADLIRTESEALIDQEAWRVAMAKEKRDRATTENWTEVENLLQGDR